MSLVHGILSTNACQHFQHHDANPACRYQMASELIAKLFPPGTPVELHSLSSSAALNGLAGRCVRYDSAEGRCVVTLTDTARKLSVKPVNLRLLFPPGSRVELHSLTSSPALNGRAGRCVRFDYDKGRCVVILDGPERQRVKVKPANLRRNE